MNVAGIAEYFVCVFVCCVQLKEIQMENSSLTRIIMMMMMSEGNKLLKYCIVYN